MDSNNINSGMPPPPPPTERDIPPPAPFEPEFSFSTPPAPEEDGPSLMDSEHPPAPPAETADSPLGLGRKEKTIAFLRSASESFTKTFSRVGAGAKTGAGKLAGQFKERAAEFLTHQITRAKGLRQTDFRSFGVRAAAAAKNFFVGLKDIKVPQNRREFLVWIEKIQAQFQSVMRRRQQKPELGKHAKILTIILCAFFLSDLVVILLEKWLPEPAPNRAPTLPIAAVLPASLSSYEAIWSRNLFSSRGLLPGEGESGLPNLDGAPIRTSLPLALIGTIMMQDPRFSIATLEDKGGGRQVYPVRVEDEVPGMFRVLEIESRKVVFLNLQSNRKEFVDVPEDDQASTSPTVVAGATPGIQQKSANHFVMSRAEIDAQMANISQVLTQARAIPHFENGVPVGLRLIQIVPGSLYDKAGIKNEDVLKAVDGEPVANDPTKGMELLTKLKTSKGLEITVNRGGRDVTISYDIN